VGDAGIPRIRLELPRPVTELHQIELSSRCNLRCVYCPSPHLQRPKVDISFFDFTRALEHVRWYRAQGTQHELNLAGIGESTLHPQFVEFVRLAREAMGVGRIVFATNGVGYGEDLVAAIAPYQPSVWVSLHRPEKAGPAIEWYRRHGLLEGVSADPALEANDWAGQVAWHSSGPTIPCHWIRTGWATVLADGRVTTCCLDASGAGVIGHVSDAVGTWRVQPYRLCGDCYQAIHVEGYEQYANTPHERLVQLRLA
jgi:hypothetical protein